MQAELKSLFSPDADPLKDFRPQGPFGILVMAIVGPAGGRGEESFDFVLCTPDWFSAQINSDFTVGRHYLFVQRFDYAKLEAFVRNYCASCVGATWDEVAEKMSRLGHWEFEDYRP
jgi:hypothetical protein